MTVDRRYVTVVSGLPRSGTSLCMKMLEAGGLAVLTDGIRHADEDNPNGYYEYEAVKRTGKDPSWVRDAVGKAVKMVYMLLYDLPAEYEYRVIFMRRDLQEVVQSQEIMLQRNRQPVGKGDEWTDVFQKELVKLRNWIDRQSNISLLDVSYNELLHDPGPVLASIQSFLDNRVDIRAMTNVIDPSLYRNRNGHQTAGVAP